MQLSTPSQCYLCARRPPRQLEDAAAFRAGEFSGEKTTETFAEAYLMEFQVPVGLALARADDVGSNRSEDRLR